MPEEAARAGTHYGKLCTLVRLAAYVLQLIRQSRSTQNRYGVKYNARFIANFLRYIAAKIMKIGSRLIKLFQK